MLKKEIELKKTIKINNSYVNFDNYEIKHDLIKKINQIDLEIVLNYHDSIKTLDVSGKINVNFDAIDARDGKLLKNNVEKVDWNEQYLFEIDSVAPDYNIVLGDEFDEIQYAIDEIVLNIPINFTKNYDKIRFVNEFGELFNEEDFAKSQQNKVDPRWEKLSEFKFDKDSN